MAPHAADSERGSFTSSQRRDTTRDGQEAFWVKDILTH